MLRCIGVAIAGALLLSGCTLLGPQVKTYRARLTAIQEVPPANSSALGAASFTLDSKSRQLAWRVSYRNLTSDVTAVVLHGPAGPGENAGAFVDLAANGIANPLEGSATLTAAQMADLMAGKTYVSIYTVRNKRGEIRGQIGG
jgi:hypothetical protein